MLKKCVSKIKKMYATTPINFIDFDATVTCFHPEWLLHQK